MLAELEKKDANIEHLAGNALQNKEFLAELVDNLTSKNVILRENSFNTLLLISKKRPDVLYSKWDYFADLLKSNNSFCPSNDSLFGKSICVKKSLNSMYTILSSLNVIITAITININITKVVGVILLPFGNILLNFRVKLFNIIL